MNTENPPATEAALRDKRFSDAWEGAYRWRARAFGAKIPKKEQRRMAYACRRMTAAEKRYADAMLKERAKKNTASSVKRTSVAHCMFTSSDSPNKTLPSAGECEANAAHIIRCVNNHDALCAALEKIAAYTKPTGMQGGSVVNEIARAVLAKVKEGV